MSDENLRYEQTPIGQPKIDREAGLLRGVHILGVQSAHGYAYSLDAQREALTFWEGLCCGANHDYSSSPLKIEQMWGVLEGPFEVRDDGTWGNLRYKQTHVLTEQILEQIEKGIGRIGLSPVNRVLSEQAKVVTKFMPTRVDMVINPATVRGAFEQAETNPDAVEDKSLQAQVAAILQQEGQSAEQLIASISAAITAHYQVNAAAEAHEEAAAELAQAQETHAAVAETTATEQAPAPAAAAPKLTTQEILNESASDLYRQRAEHERYEQLTARLAALEGQIKLHEQYVAPKATLERTIAQTTQGIDLKSFWQHK